MNNDLDLNYQPHIEKFCGIEVYSTDTPPLGGEIKKNLSDFIVKEITPNGEILDTDLPDCKFRKDYNLCSKRNYTYFTLIKQGEDTIIAAELISKALGVPLQNISWAGLKDNRAITVQRMCIKGDYAKELSQLDFTNLKIKDIHYGKHPVRTGDLRGNFFVVTIRNLGYDSVNKPIDDFIKYDNEKIRNIFKNTIQQIKERGIPNFFGLQRFGTYRPNSQIVGKLIFLNEFEKAVNEMLITTYPKEIEEVKTARLKLAVEKNFNEALKYFPNSLVYERKLIQSLIYNPENFRNALLSLPKSILKLIISSYQSYLFNLSISNRLKKGFPLSIPQKNDLISILDEPNGLVTHLLYRFGKWYDPYFIKLFKMDRATILCNVLGFQSEFKNTFFEPIINEILKNENFSLEMFKFNFLKNELFKGTYRSIFVKPKYFNGKYLPKNKDRNHTLELKFSLPKGSYATMLIREFTKV